MYDETHDRTGSAHPIALAHVQSSDHLVIRAILSHNLTTLVFVVQQLHSDTRLIVKFNVFTSHNAHSESCEFRMSNFHMRLFWQQFTNHIYFFQLHEYFVASARASIVKGALYIHTVSLTTCYTYKQCYITV